MTLDYPCRDCDWQSTYLYRGLAPPMHVQLVKNVVHVVLDRRSADPQCVGDLLVRHSFTEEAEDLPFSRRQWRQLGWSRPWLSERCNTAGQHTGDTWRAIEFSAQRLFDRSH